MNKNTPKVSVILPSLNVADYIEECIDSVVHRCRLHRRYKRNPGQICQRGSKNYNTPQQQEKLRLSDK